MFPEIKGFHLDCPFYSTPWMISWMIVALTYSCYGTLASMSTNPVTALSVVPKAQEERTNRWMRHQENRSKRWGQKLSHINSKVQAKNPLSFCTKRALTTRGRLISLSPTEPWHESSDPSIRGAWAPANRYTNWWALSPGAASTAAWIPWSLFPSSPPVFCHCVMSNHCQVADCTPPKYKGIRFQDTGWNEYNNGSQNSAQTTYQARKQLISVASGFGGGGPGVHFLGRQV